MEFGDAYCHVVNHRRARQKVFHSKSSFEAFLKILERKGDVAH
jgi:hypothetical protein